MGNIAYFEIPSDDVERAKKFYKNVFGWNIEKAEGGDMSQLNSGGLMKRMYPGQGITNYVQVDSVDKTMEMVKKNGGKEMGERMNIPGVGRLGFFVDSEGNALALWEPEKKK